MFLDVSYFMSSVYENPGVFGKSLPIEVYYFDGYLLMSGDEERAYSW